VEGRAGGYEIIFQEFEEFFSRIDEIEE